MKYEDVEIGASQAAAPLGVSPYRSKYQFYAEKLKLIDRQPTSDAMLLGTHLEHGLADVFSEKYGVKLRPWERVIGVERPWLRVTPDRVIFPSDMPSEFARYHGFDPGEGALVEIKTTGLSSPRPMSKINAEWGEEGSGKIPIQYYVQVQLQLLVMNQVLLKMDKGFITRAFVIALIPGKGLCEYIVKANEESQKEILDGLEDFINNHLVPEIPPEPETQNDWKSYASVVSKLGASKDLIRGSSGDEIDMMIRSYSVAKEMMDDASLEVERLRAKIIEKIGDSYGIVSDSGKITYSAGKISPRLSQSAFTNEVMKMAKSDANSEDSARARVARTILEIAERNTKQSVTGRALRLTRSK